MCSNPGCPDHPKAYIGTAPPLHEGPHEWECVKCEAALKAGLEAEQKAILCRRCGRRPRHTMLINGHDIGGKCQSCFWREKDSPERTLLCRECCSAKADAIQAEMSKYWKSGSLFAGEWD